MVLETLRTREVLVRRECGLDNDLTDWPDCEATVTGCKGGGAAGLVTEATGLAVFTAGVVVVGADFDRIAVSDVESLLAAITERFSELS